MKIQSKTVRQSLIIVLSLLIFTPLFGQSESDLFEKTLYSDIETASYYELLNWCRDLDLETKGNADFLRNQLFRHYDLNLSQRTETDDSGNTIVKILSADTTEYYTIEEIDEDYVRISGRVELVVKQTAENITHRIEADTITFNQSSNTMTARGEIIYVKEENDMVEEYRGDNFTFNVNNWKGVILQGDFYSTKEVNEKEIEFVFSGEAIKKGEGDVVVLDRGSITSEESIINGDSSDSYYKLKARKIWILGPDEWAILSGTFYVGHVPLLYIPFYHLPGNDLFFNPVIGQEDRRGFFIQTTTYLLGRKEVLDEGSLFPNFADSDETYQLVPVGLYLFKEPGEPEERSSDFIKYKLDYYSRLGGFTALEGSLSKLWKFNNITFDLGLAVTKSIKDPDSDSGFHTNYFTENDYNASWNSSYFFGADLPLRYGFDFGFSLLTFSTSFEYQSDPYFESDFINREENFDWLNYILAQTTQEEDEEESSKNSLNWSVQGNVNVPNEWAGQYINSLSLNPVKMNLYWSSKANIDYAEPDDSTVLYDPYSPASEFFYPDNIIWPQTSLNLSGILYEYRDATTDPHTVDDPVGDREDIRSPWDMDENDVNDKEEEVQETGDLNQPDKMDNLPVVQSTGDFYAKVDYGLSGYVNFISYTDSELWDSPSDVDFEILKSLLTNNNSLKFNYQMSLFNKMLSFNGTNSMTSNYLDYYGDISDDETTRELDGRKFQWKNTFDFSYRPFVNVPEFSNTSLSYDLDTDLYDYSYDQETEDYIEDWIEWEEDYITTHRAAVNLDYALSFLRAAVSFDTSLAPLETEQSISPSLELKFFNWTNKASLKAVYKLEEETELDEENDEEPEKEWTLEPFTWNSSFSPMERMSLSSDLTYSFEEDSFTAYSARVSLWGFNGAFNMAYTTDYSWNIDTQSLVPDEEKSFIPTSVSLGYSYNYESPLLWKNRIKMGGGVSTAFNMNLLQYNLTSLSFSLNYNIHIHQFLDLKFKMNSSNDHMFLYFAGIREYYGISGEYSFFEDLFQSFNIFSSDQEDRYASFFNMDLLELSLVHKLNDWDLELIYSGKPVINEQELDSRWDSTFSILVRWNPIEALKVRTDYEEEQWNVDTEFGDEN